MEVFLSLIQSYVKAWVASLLEPVWWFPFTQCWSHWPEVEVGDLSHWPEVEVGDLPLLHLTPPALPYSVPGQGGCHNIGWGFVICRFCLVYLVL